MCYRKKRFRDLNRFEDDRRFKMRIRGDGGGVVADSGSSGKFPPLKKRKHL
jgi:hypothetical protein